MSITFEKIQRLFKLPLWDKFNFTSLQYRKFITLVWYRLFFDSIGQGSTLISPLILIGINKVELGNKVFIRNNARIETVNDGIIIFEDNVSIEQNFHITSAGNLVIGNNTTISFGVMITNIDHEYHEIDTHILKQNIKVLETRIADHCFIGAGAKIQAGTILGKQCIVGANAVVRGHYPDYCVIVGVPAKVVKRYNPVTKRWHKTDHNGDFLDS